MRGLKRCVVLSAWVLWSVAVPVAANAQERDGFWFGIGGGGGSAAITCDDCNEGRESSGVASIRLGWTLSKRLLIGGEVNVWDKTFVVVDEGVKATATDGLYNFAGTLTFYPKVTSGFFVKGGAGMSAADIQLDVAGTNVTVNLGTGPGLIAGAGYDFRVGRKISVTPAVNAWYGQLGDVKLAGERFLKLAGEPFLNNWKHNVIDFTLGITFH